MMAERNLCRCVLERIAYMHGFQKDGSRDYAPSYVVLAGGWQASL